MTLKGGTEGDKSENAFQHVIIQILQGLLWRDYFLIQQQLEVNRLKPECLLTKMTNARNIMPHSTSPIKATICAPSKLITDKEQRTTSRNKGKKSHIPCLGCLYRFSSHDLFRTNDFYRNEYKKAFRFCITWVSQFQHSCYFSITIF